MKTSTAVSSAVKGAVFNEENEVLYDPYPSFTTNNSCDQVHWPEWRDADLNAETWDEGRGGKTPTAGGPRHTTSVTASGGLFNDPDPPKLLPTLSSFIYMWKRPQEVFQSSVLTVYDPSNLFFELKLPFSVAPAYDFFETFAELLPILQFYAVKYGFSVELETPHFVANTQGEPWRPWHHIYAMCKAGKGQVHKPLYCPSGKYVVRLFYMGAWRRFVVDDKIPCDVKGNCMLPTTQVAGELWPIILTKAILKILSLTPSYDSTAIDLPFLSLFTGWTQGMFTAMNKSRDQVWRRFVALIPRYEQSQRGTEAEGKSVAPSARNLPVKKESSKKDERVLDKGETQAEKFCFILCALKGVSFDEILYEDYSVALTMVRDSPLVNAVKREGTKPWKRIRWIYWAKEKGLWTDENQLPPYRRLQIITFCRNLSELLTPDQKLEAFMYETTNEDDLNVKDESSNDRSSFYEPEQWCDYSKLLKYLFSVQVFFKPSYFTTNVKVSCMKEKPAESVAGGKTTSKIPVAQNAFLYPFRLKPTYNEPIFVMCESPTGIFLYVSVWVSPQAAKTCLGYLESHQPKFLKIGHASLVIENYTWTSFEQGEIAGLVKTVGNSTIALNLKPGRHILKFWLSSDSPYVIDMYSNANFSVEKSPKLRFLMTSESQMILNYITEISNAFIVLTQKFGKPDLPTALRDFYETIKPGHDGDPDYLKKLDEFIEIFLNCILLTLKDLVSNVDEVRIMMWALRCLFINPNIKCDLPGGEPMTSIYGGSSVKKNVKKVVAVKERTLSEILNYLWSPEEIEKIIKVQKVFRGFRVRMLWKCQGSGRKEFKPFAERLKKICDVMFVPPKRESEVGKLLRRIIIVEPQLLTTFRFYKDFFNVVQVEEYTGKILNVEPFAWVPIARFVIACHFEGRVPCAFYLSCNLEKFVIQGFDNDSGKEIFRVTNCLSPHYYESNENGYTIFVFGWNEANSKTVNWRLEMVKMKHFEVLHLCNALMNSGCQPYPMPTFEVFEIRNFYIPNSISRICRCLIKITKRTLLTLRFSTSYTDVQFVVIIFLDKRFCGSDSNCAVFGKVVAEVTATNGAVIVPALVLEYIENQWWGESYSENCTLYIFEAFVLNNSWPLTKQEWGFVEPMRVSRENWKESAMSLYLKRGSESRKKLTRTSRKSLSEQKLESPSWLLQVLNDSAGPEAGEPIIIEEDKSYSESVKLMKMSWEEKDPGRRQRGKNLRREFVYSIYVEEKKKHLCFAEDVGEGISEKGDEALDEPQILLDRLSSFSYLLNDTSPTRYTYSPRTLPSMPLCELLLKYKKFPESAISKSSELNLDSDNTRSLDSSDFVNSKMPPNIVESVITEAEENRKDFLRQSLNFRSVMSNHLDEEHKLSCKLMNEAYESRSKVIERMMT